MGMASLDDSGDRLPLDLLELAACLVEIPSVSHHEADLADVLESELSRCGHLELERLGNSIVARTQLSRAVRLVLAGHIDTVAPPGGESAATRVDGDVLHGLGAVDMKGGVALLVDLARSVKEPGVDVTYVFYACEEVDHRYNELDLISRERPELLRGQAAVLLEPTGGVVQAGCQGTMRAMVRLAGRRAHTARPWMGVNAIHRAGHLLCLLERYTGRKVVIDDCEYAEQLQAVGIEGGVAGNVVPDEARITLNYRFAPDRSLREAEAALRELLCPVIDESAGDTITVLDAAPAAAPSLGDPLLARLVDVTGKPPQAKVGWTDVATFYGAGVPAANFGPGDPELAHTEDEHVSRDELAFARRVLGELVS